MQNINQIKKEKIEDIQDYFYKVTADKELHSERRNSQIIAAKHRTRAEKRAHKEKHNAICAELNGGNVK